MENTNEHRARRAAIVKEMKTLHGSRAGAEWTDDDQGTWDRLSAKAGQIGATVERDEQIAAIERSDDHPALEPDAIDYRYSEPGAESPVLVRDGRGEPGDLPISKDPLKSRPLARDERCEDFIRRADASRGVAAGDYRGLSLGATIRAWLGGPRNELEKRAMSEGTDSAGGFLVPSILSGRIIDRLRPRSHVLTAGAQIVPLRTDSTTIARISGDPAGSWIAESASVTAADATLAGLAFTPQTFAVVVKASRQLVEDADPRVEAALEMSLSKAFASELDRVALLGSGSGAEPTGVRNASGVTELSMGTNGAAISDYDEILDLIEDLADANAPAPTAAIMAPRTATTIGKFADSTGQPLRRPAGIEDLRFLSTAQVGVAETQGSSSIASTIFLGAWNELMIGMRTNFRLQVLKERYADNMQLGFLAYIRFDIALAHAASLGRLVGVIP